MEIGKTRNYVDNYYSKLKYASGLLADGSQAFLKMRQNLDNALHGAVNISIESIGTGDWFHNWAASTLSWRKQLFSDELSVAGAINERLMRTSNAAYNVFKDYISSQALPVAKRHFNELKTMLPGVERKTLEQIIHDSAIVGSTDEILEAIGVNSYGGKLYLDKRIESFMTRLTDLGLNQSQIETIIRNGKEYADIYRIGQAYLMEGAGANLERLPGYVPIVFDKKLQKAVTQKFPSFQEVIDKSFLNVGNDILGSSANKARKEFIDYVINDVAYLKTRLSNIFPDIDDTKILGWIEDADLFKQEVVDVLSDNALETLMKEGTISKIPSMHSTIIETLMRRDGIPAGLAEELFLTDPKLALKQWGETLERITRESFVTRDLVTNGIDQGWVVDKAVADLNPKQFVPMNTIPLFTKFFDPHTAKAVGDQYVHKIVARQLNTVLELNSNPIAAGVLGTSLNAFGRYTSYFGRGILGNPVTATAQVTQNLIQVVSAVGTPAYVPQGLSDAFRFMTKGLDGFSPDSMLKLGDELISERDLMYRIMATRGGLNLGEITTPGALTVDNFKEFFKHDIKAVVNRGLLNAQMRPLGAIQDVLDEATQLLFKQTAFANYFADVAGRMAILRTIADEDNFPNAVKGLASIFDTKIGTVEDALRYTDEYISFFDGKSDLASVSGRFVRPFASYLMSAPGQTVRHVMRHPKRFNNALDLYHHYAITADRDNYGYDRASWQRGKMLVPLWENPETKERVMFSPGMLDNTLNTIEFVDNSLNAASRLSGKNTRDKVADLEAFANPAKATADYIGSLWEGNYLETIESAITGRNAFTGGDPSPTDSVKVATWFGIPMSPRMRAIMQMSLPFSNQLERMLPAEIVGKRAVNDPFGNPLEPAVPSIFGAIPESGGARGNMGVNAGLGVIGVRPIYSDTILNLSRTVGDLERIKSDARDVQRYLLQKGRANDPAFQQATDVIAEADLIILDVNTVAIDEGVTPPKAIQILKQRLDAPNQLLLRSLNESSSLVP
jgi:hypothetical protein